MEKWRGSGAVGGADSGYLHRSRREKKRGSKNVAHIRDNLDILDFALTEDEMAQIAALDKGVRYYHRTDEQLRQFAAWRPSFGR